MSAASTAPPRAATAAACARPIAGEAAGPRFAPRLALLVAAFAWVVACGPGALWRGGSPLVVLGLAVWAELAARPARGAGLAEWLAGSLWGAATMFWAAYVWWPLLLWIGPGWGLYTLGAGALLRRCARRLPLALAAPLALCAMEGLRALLPPPFGSPWLRIGHHALALPLVSGALRVVGTGGLTFALAALAGALADLAGARAMGRSPLARCGALGLAPLALAALLGAAVPPPPSEAGPLVLLVQPAFEQARKQRPGDPDALFAEQLALTRRGIAQDAEPPEFVLWGETLLYAPLIPPDTLEAASEGLQAPAWWGIERERLPALLRAMHARAAARLQALRETLPAGTAFLCGAEAYLALEGRLGRTNAVGVWDDQGRLVAVGAKSFLVPGAETMFGLERYDAVRRVVAEIAGYVPDFLPADRSAVAALARPGGGVQRVGLSVCYDNAFEEPFVGTLRREPVDWFAVVSNEAWYRGSFELDQMVAFTRALAIETGRSIARATNSGITLVVGPDGVERARLVVRGEDRDVRGTLTTRVPVPVGGAGAPRPPYVHWAPLAPWVWLLLPLLCLLPRSRASLRKQPAGNGYRVPRGG